MAYEELKEFLNDDQIRETSLKLYLKSCDPKGRITDLKKVYQEKFGKEKAELLTSVEGSRFWVICNQVDWQKSGYIKNVKWRTVNDEFVCEVCRKRAEKEFPLDQIDKLLPAHEGCRCWVTPIVDDDEFVRNIFEDLQDGEFINEKSSPPNLLKSIKNFFLKKRGG